MRPATSVKPPLLILALVLLLLLPAGPARGCTVPVFRYALEHWRPAPYEVVVFQRGALPPSARAAVRKLEQANAPANLTLEVVDLDGKVEGKLAGVWQRESARATLPWLVALYPEDEEGPAIAWAPPLSEENVALLRHSPARQRLVQFLASGESAVWVVLESGDARADRAALDLLGRELPRLQKKLELPEQSPEGPGLRTDLPLRVSFQVVTVSRSAPAELAFVQTLLHLDPDLAKVRGPIVFPVIGRGRALVGLHGAKLTAQQVEDWAAFLCGACSCQAKEENPGTDLLLSANWEALLGPVADEEERPSKGRNQAVAIPPGRAGPGPAPSAPGEERQRWWWVGGGVAGVIALLAGARVLRSRHLGER